MTEAFSIWFGFSHIVQQHGRVAFDGTHATNLAKKGPFSMGMLYVTYVSGLQPFWLGGPMEELATVVGRRGWFWAYRFYKSSFVDTGACMIVHHFCSPVPKGLWPRGWGSHYPLCDPIILIFIRRGNKRCTHQFLSKIQFLVNQPHPFQQCHDITGLSSGIKGR